MTQTVLTLSADTKGSYRTYGRIIVQKIMPSSSASCSLSQVMPFFPLFVMKNLILLFTYFSSSLHTLSKLCGSWQIKGWINFYKRRGVLLYLTWHQHSFGVALPNFSPSRGWFKERCAGEAVVFRQTTSTLVFAAAGSSETSAYYCQITFHKTVIHWCLQRQVPLKRLHITVKLRSIRR